MPWMAWDSCSPNTIACKKVSSNWHSDMTENKIQVDELSQQLFDLQQQAKTVVLVAVDGDLIGLIGIADRVKEGSKDAIRKLSQMGLELIMVTGDNQHTAEAVARSVELPASLSGDQPGVYANVLPGGKVERVKALQSQGKILAMVGDGINDAPALAAADVGIAMGAKGTEVALETADIALMQDDISKLPFLIKLGRRMVATVKWNIFFGLVFNLIAVLAGGSGLLTPIMGAVVHNIGSVLVVLSSASIAFAGD